MATIQELDDLTKYIRRMLPDLKQLSNMRNNETAGAVEFDWHARHFVVTPALAVFELKGQTLTLTCSSILMQAALRTKDKHAKVVGAIIESLRAAEETMRGKPTEGLALLEAVKRSLVKLIGKPDLNLRAPSRAALRP
ncbi:MAG: hypothetical protein HY735_07890 [Verrucomicrobia bacterium]|nr:hypothetical protein [Verrucomicrobiota bacterium]